MSELSAEQRKAIREKYIPMYVDFMYHEQIDQIQQATAKAERERVIGEIWEALDGAHKFHSPHAIKSFLLDLKESI